MIILPKEHGVWAMLAVPFIVGLGLSQQSWLHLPLFLGLLFLFLCAYCLLNIIGARNGVDDYKKWSIIYGAWQYLVWRCQLRNILGFYGWGFW
ncbi:hypothetical protein N752_21705 [Desulforamulus aquiferis]|nr:hypothetical protein N752_21705 [Desulforamulus aquiferis]